MNIKIGKDENTQESVLLSEESRSKVVSIIGPTSAGKISLSILPMVNEDINLGNGVIYIGKNKNVCDVILDMAREEGRKYFYIDLNGEGSEYLNIFNLLGTDEEIESIIDRCILDSYKVYLKKSLRLTDDVVDKIKDSYSTIETVLGVLKQFKGEEMTLRDLYYLSKNDSDLVDLVFLGGGRVKTEKQNILMDLFKKWHKSTYCNQENGLYENNKYFIDMLSKIIEDKNIEKSIVPGELRKLDLLNAINNNSVIVINQLNDDNESAMFINHIITSIVSMVAHLKSEGKTNLYLHNSSEYVSSMFIDRVNEMNIKNNSSRLGVHVIEETFTPEGCEKEFKDMLLNSSNVILYPGCTKGDELIFKAIISDFSKKEIKSIGDVRFAPFKRAAAKLQEGNSSTLRKLELSFVD